MQEKQGDREAGNVSKVIVRIARDCDLGRSGSARDVLHWEGESDIVAENWRELVWGREEKVLLVLILFVFMSRAEHLQML